MDIKKGQFKQAKKQYIFCIEFCLIYFQERRIFKKWTAVFPLFLLKLMNLNRVVLRLTESTTQWNGKSMIGLFYGICYSQDDKLSKQTKWKMKKKTQIWTVSLRWFFWTRFLKIPIFDKKFRI